MKKFFISASFLALMCLCSLGYSQTTFNYTGGVQTYTVPAGVTAIAIDAQGAMGGGINCAYTNWQSLGGCGGRVQATVNVTPGHVLNITVGGKPAATGAGGYGGGGNDLALWTTVWPGAGGGGGTTITDATAGTTLVVAGGGGGGGGDVCPSVGTFGDVGGAGGGLTGAAGNSNICGIGVGGQGGTPAAGGIGGTCAPYVGGTGSAGTGATVPGSAGLGSGGGGGGWFGGGSGAYGGGGGGGSSYSNATYTTAVIHTQGYNCGNGIVIINTACNAGTITGGSTTVCTGQTLSLTDATGGGVWSSSNTTVATVSGTGVVSGAGAGTATISYSVGGCSALYVVTVYTMPAAITGTLTVCQFATTALGETIGGGSWGSSNTAVAIVSGTGVVTGVAGGTSIISYTTGGTCTQSVIVTVNTAPGALSGVPNVCVGLTVTISNTVAGGTWSSSNPAIGTISTPGTFGGISSGTTTLTYMMPGNCYMTTTGTVNPAPSAIGGTFTVCQGQTTALTNTVGGGAWSSSNTAAGTVNSVTGVVTGMGGGTTTISYTSANCTPVTAVVTVYPVSAISPAAPVLCTGTNITLSDALAGTWSSSNTAVAVIGLSTGVLTGIAPGTSTIVFTFTTGCTTSVVATVNLSPVAISGTTAICQGNVATFSDLTPGGAWSSSNTATGSIVAGSGVFTALAAGVTTISYVMPVTGCYATQALTVNPVPAPISGTMSVCAGLSTTLTDATPGGAWTCTPASISAINPVSGNIFGIMAGTSIVSYTLPTGCYSIGIFTVNPSPQAILGNHSMCLGYTTQLTDASTGGTWSSSNTAVGTIDPSSGLAYGAGTGTTTITYTLTAGCTSTTTVTVNPNPTAVSGPTNGCIGFTATMTDATGGGTWSTSNNTVVNIGSSTGFLMATVSGTDTVFYTLNTGCWAGMVFTVNPQPAAISGTPYVCVGLSETLTDLSGGGSWSASNANATIGSATGFVTGVTPGVDIITYTLPTTCYTTFPLTITTPPTAISGPDNVCVNSAITLSDGTTPGTWVLTPVSGNASISTSGVVTGISQGVVVVSYTTFSCNPVVYAVTVNPLPAPITGLGNVCFGATISLSDVTVGGTWSSSNSAATVSSAGVVTGLSQGLSSTITYALPTSCFVTAPVSIDSIPKAIMGIDSVCPGSSVWLSDSTPGGVWSSTDGTIDSCFGFTGQVKGIRAGTVTISYKLISGCGVSMQFKVISPLPASMTMTQSPTPLVCDGDPVTFTVSPVNGGTPTYTWYKFGTIYLASGPTPSYTYNAYHGDYITCKMATGNICASPALVEVSQVVNIYPNVLPSISISTLATSDSASYLGEVFTFYSNVTNGGVGPTYQWYINNTLVPGATDNTFTTHIYNENDTIYCMVNGIPPCDLSSVASSSNAIIIYGLGYLSAGSLNAANNNLSLFPNPNTGTFTLSGILGTASNTETEIEVVDMLGRTVYTGKTIPQNGEIKAEIKLGNDAAAGTYLLRVFTETGTETFHFVIGK